jgi:hypothetical protein
MNNILRTAKFLPTWGFSQRHCLGLYLTEVPGWLSAPEAHSRVSNINFEIWIFFCAGGLYKYSMNTILRRAKFLPNWGFNQRYWPGLLLNEVPGWVSAPQAHSRVSNINFDIWFLFGRGLYKYPMNNILRTAKFLPIWGFSQRHCLGLYLTEVPGWVSAPQANSRVSNINFDIWIFFCGGGLYKYPMNNILRIAQFLPTWGFNQRYCLGL